MAFNFQDLIKSLEAQGLPALEADVKAATVVTFNWIKAGAAEMALVNKWYLIAIPLLDALEPAILAMEDKISPDPAPADPAAPAGN